MDQQADESALLAAIDSLRRSVDASPDNPVLMVSLAQLLLSASDAGAAIGLATPVLSLQPDSPAGAEVLAAATAILTSTARASDATPSDDDREHAKLTTAPHPLSAADAIDDMLEELREQERRHSVLLSHVAGLFEQRLETSFLGPIRNPAPMDSLPRARRPGPKRNWLRGDSMHNVVAQLSNELDSAAANNEGVFVLAATNQPWNVDTPRFAPPAGSTGPSSSHHPTPPLAKRSSPTTSARRRRRRVAVAHRAAHRGLQRREPDAHR